MPSQDAPLSPHETRILVALKDGRERDLDAIAEGAGLELAQVRSAVESLKTKGSIEPVREVVARAAFLTPQGEDYAKKKHA